MSKWKFKKEADEWAGDEEKCVFAYKDKNDAENYIYKKVEPIRGSHNLVKPIYPNCTTTYKIIRTFQMGVGSNKGLNVGVSVDATNLTAEGVFEWLLNIGKNEFPAFEIF